MCYVCQVSIKILLSLNDVCRPVGITITIIIIIIIEACLYVCTYTYGIYLHDKRTYVCTFRSIPPYITPYSDCHEKSRVLLCVCCARVRYRCVIERDSELDRVSP